MSKPLPDVRVGDVWRSKAGRDVRVEDVGLTRYKHVISNEALVVVTGKSGAELILTLRNFPRGRRLIERDGKPVEQS